MRGDVRPTWKGCASLDGIFQTLNENAGAIQVIFSALVTAATVVYAVLTWMLVSETRRMRRAQTDAKVAISLDSRPGYLNFIDLLVRNEGVGPAYDIRFEVAMVGGGGDDSVLEAIQSLGFVEHGMDYFSPGQEIRSFLTSMTENFEAKMKTRIQVRTCYRTASGEQVNDVYLLDFSVFKGRCQLGEPDLHSIAKSLKSIATELGHITSGFKKPHVITQDKSDYIREQEERFESTREARTRQLAATENESVKSGEA